MTERLALRRAKIRERAHGRLQARGETADAEGFEARHAEVRAELGARAPAAEHGGIAEAQRGSVRTKLGEQIGGFATRLRQDHLRRASEQRGGEDAVAMALTAEVLPGPELAGRHVDERDPGAFAAARHGEEEVVHAPGEIRGVRDRARRDDAHDVAAKPLLAFTGCLNLLADRDLPARLHQTRDVGFRRVVRDAGHRRALAGGQRDREELRTRFGVLEEELVEVAEAKEQEEVRIALLELAVLRHHRRQGLKHQGDSAGAPTSGPVFPATHARRPRPA